MKKWLYFIVTTLIVAMFAGCKGDSNEDEPEPPTPEKPAVKQSMVQFDYGTITVDRSDRRVIVPFVIHSENDSVKQILFHIEAYNCPNPADKLNKPVSIKEKSVYVMSGSNKCELEFNIDFGEFSEWNFSYLVKMVSATGATIGATNTCTVLVRSKVEDVYDKFSEYVYALTYTDSDGDEQRKMVEFECAIPEEVEYRKILYLCGEGYSLSFVMPIKYITNDVGQGVSLELTGGCQLGSDLSFDAFGSCDLVTGFRNGNDIPTEDGFLRGYWSDDLKEISFDGTLSIIVKTTPDNDSGIGPNVILGVYDTWSNIKLTAVEKLPSWPYAEPVDGL